MFYSYCCRILRVIRSIFTESRRGNLQFDEMEPGPSDPRRKAQHECPSCQKQFTQRQSYYVTSVLFTRVNVTLDCDTVW